MQQAACSAARPQSDAAAASWGLQEIERKYLALGEEHATLQREFKQLQQTKEVVVKVRLPCPPHPPSGCWQACQVQAALPKRACPTVEVRCVNPRPPAA